MRLSTVVYHGCQLHCVEHVCCVFHSQMIDLIITSPLTSICAELQNHSIQMNSSSYASAVLRVAILSVHLSVTRML